jgi:hypothetical protein
MKLKIVANARRRNGVAEAPFDVVLFKGFTANALP